MAMYYYASKLNEASCSGCHMKVPPPPAEPAPEPPQSSDHSLSATSAILHGSGLSYYDNDDYYSMVRGNKFITEASCKHLIMNGTLNFVDAQPKSDGQIPTLLGPVVKPYQDCVSDKPDVEYKDGQIVSATMETLVDMLRPGASKSFTFTFLLCSRLFIKPHELLNKLCKRYFKNYDKIGKNEIVEKELSDMKALVRILNQWTSTFPYDFRDDRVMALVRSITQRCAAEHMASVRGEVSVMLEKLLEKLTALEQYEETLVDTPAVTSTDQLPLGDILTLGLTPIELANQLTIVELHRLSFVGPEEFVQTFAPTQPPPPAGARATISLHHVETKSTRNLEAYADWFNRLSYLVATDILKSVKTKYRARVMEQWVMTARECFNLGNFNSLMAIISALNMNPITRLKKTWGRTSAVCGQQLRQLELCVEPSGNHARYRAALAAAPSDSAVPLLAATCRDLHFANQGSPNKAISLLAAARYRAALAAAPSDSAVPLLAATCRDLHFANQGSPNKLPGNRVNLEKWSLLARHVSSQLASRRLVSEDGPAAPPPAPHPPVWRFLNDRPTLTETALELTSFEREPPVDHLEKERLKRLRGAT